MLRQVVKGVCGIDKKLDRSSAVTDAKYWLVSADFKIFVWIVLATQFKMGEGGEEEIQQQLAEIKDMSMPDLVKSLLKSMQQCADVGKQNAELIRKLSDQAAQAPDVVAIRAEKISKLNLALRKSSKIKDYKDTQDLSMKEWLRKYEEEILVLKRMSGIDDALSCGD